MKQKIILILGASSGLGRAIALTYAQADNHIIAAARNKQALYTLREEVLRQGGHCTVFACDICSEEAVQQLIAATIKQYGHIDIAVLSSGVQYIDQVAQLSTSEVDTMFQTNVIGVIRCVRYLLPNMLAQKSGQIVLISSIMGDAAFPHMVSYGATKAAITCFARGLQREVATQGIDVTLVSPGHMNTNISAHLENRLSHWYGKSGSLNISDVAEQVVEAVKQKRTEIVIGRQTKMLGRMIRFLPPVANNIIRKITT